MHIREQLINELNEARGKMQAIVETIGGDTEIYGPWHLKEVLAHISGWDDATIEAIQAHASGAPPPLSATRGIDYYNAQTVSTREALPYEHIMREWKRTRTQLVDLLHSLSDEKFEEPLTVPWGPTSLVEQLVRVMSHHEAEHADEIMGMIENRELSPDDSAT